MIYAGTTTYLKLFGEPFGSATADVIDMAGNVVTSVSFTEISSGAYVAPVTFLVGDYVVVATTSWDTNKTLAGVHVVDPPLDAPVYLGLR